MRDEKDKEIRERLRAAVIEQGRDIIDLAWAIGGDAYLEKDEYVARVNNGLLALALMVFSGSMPLDGDGPWATQVHLRHTLLDGAEDD